MVIKQTHFIGGNSGVVFQVDLELGLLTVEQTLARLLNIDLRAGFVSQHLDIDWWRARFVDATVTGAQYQLQHLAAVATAEFRCQAQTGFKVGIKALTDQHRAKGTGVWHLDGFHAVHAAEKGPGSGVFFVGYRVNKYRVDGVDKLVVARTALQLKASARIQAKVAGRFIQLQGRGFGVVDNFQLELGFSDLPGAIGGACTHHGVGASFVWYAQGRTDITASAFIQLSAGYSFEDLGLPATALEEFQLGHFAVVGGQYLRSKGLPFVQARARCGRSHTDHRRQVFTEREAPQSRFGVVVVLVFTLQLNQQFLTFTRYGEFELIVKTGGLLFGGKGAAVQHSAATQGPQADQLGVVHGAQLHLHLVAGIQRRTLDWRGDGQTRT